MNNEECGICDVWAHNLDKEFRTIRQIVQKYNYVAMVIISTFVITNFLCCVVHCVISYSYCRILSFQG